MNGLLSTSLLSKASIWGSGKKYATGIGAFSNDANPLLTVTGLNFQPSVIYAYLTNHTDRRIFACPTYAARGLPGSENAIISTIGSFVTITVDGFTCIGYTSDGGLLDWRLEAATWYAYE
jgi:hypothetical protein